MSNSYEERRRCLAGSFEYLLDDDDRTAWLGDGDCGDTVVFTVPDSVEIGGRVFRVTSVEMDFGSVGVCDNKDFLRELIIPNSIEYIDEYAFAGYSIEKIRIGNMGISGCQRLEPLVLPVGLEDTQGLSENRALKVVDLPSTLKVLDGEAFCNDACLEMIIFRTEALPTIPWYLAVGYTPVDTCRLIVPRHRCRPTGIIRNGGGSAKLNS